MITNAQVRKLILLLQKEQKNQEGFAKWVQLLSSSSFEVVMDSYVYDTLRIILPKTLLEELEYYLYEMWWVYGEPTVTGIIYWKDDEIVAEFNNIETFITYLVEAWVILREKE